VIKKRLMISMNADLVGEPFLYRLVKDFDIVPGVRTANVRGNEAWMALELQAESDDQIRSGIGYLKEMGATVKPLEGDIVEG